MIEIETRDFHGDRDLLAKLLQEKLRVQARVERNRIRLVEDKLHGPLPSFQDVKDQLKRALHHMRSEEYRVVVEKGVLSIREEKVRERYSRRKGSVPSVKQSVPYFFPG